VEKKWNLTIVFAAAIRGTQNGAGHKAENELPNKVAIEMEIEF